MAYIGNELELFASTRNWKAYLREVIEPYLGRHVLEVGAGIGSTTAALCPPSVERWVCLEPDRELASQIEAKQAAGELPACCAVRVGTVRSLPEDLAAGFDSILYVDVLEHIEDDRGEVGAAARLLRPGGHLVVMAPAHQSLYTPFDRAIGHFRRYDRASLRAVAAEGTTLKRMIYLDSVGLLASTANRALLRQAMPTRGQIATWDRLMIPASRWLDRRIGHAIGKSVLGVWTRDGSGHGAALRAPAL